MIMSLVYDRGTILASKRSSYDDLVQNGFDEKVLGDRLHKQHRLICAAVRAGRIDDLKKMSVREADGVKPALAKVKVSTKVSVAPAAPAIERPIPRPAFAGAEESHQVVRPLEPLVEAFIIDENFVLPDEAVEIVPEKPAFESASRSRLSVEVLGDASFKAGDRRTVGFMVCRGSDRKVVGDAQIMVKILGSSFRPQIFHAKTDANGVARISVQFPTFNVGRAAFLVRAISEGEEVELRRPIAHG